MKFLGKLFVCLLLIGTGYFLCEHNILDKVINIIKELIDNLDLLTFKY